jgi:cell division protein FtsZ
MTLLEVDHAANIIRQSVNPEANIIFGSLIDETLQGKLKISIFATGIEASGKKILYYPESENNSGFSSIQNKVDESLSYDGSDIKTNEDISRVVEEKPVTSENEEFNLTNEIDQNKENTEEII